MLIHITPELFVENSENPPLHVRVEGVPLDPTGAVVTFSAIDTASRAVPLAPVSTSPPSDVSEQTGATPFARWDFSILFSWGPGDLPDAGIYIGRFQLDNDGAPWYIDAPFKVIL